MFSFFRSRRQKLLRAPFPASWESFLVQNCRHYTYLPAEKQELLKDCVKVIVQERDWVGVQALQVTDEMKVTVAAEASLLLLGNEGYYYDKVTSILIHPRGFTSRTTNADLHKRFERATPVVGEAHYTGSINLLWSEVLAGARGKAGGSNLTLHEFAHHIDSLDGELGGMPPLPSRQEIRRWEEVIDREYERLVDDVQLGRLGILDSYGATNKAEFFAVATECFYETPSVMNDELPELYALLRDLYRIDPAHWWPDVEDVW